MKSGHWGLDDLNGPEQTHSVVENMMSNTDSTLSDLRYFDLKKHWTKKVLPHLKNEKLIAVLVEDLDKLAFSRWDKHFTADMVPAQFDSCDWRFNHRGTQP